jgi:hypothetical protein
MEEMLELSCFCLDGEEWVIARSAEDALSLWEEAYGETWETAVGEPLGDNWSIWTLERELTIHGDDGTEKRTVGEWIKRNGRGLLCSANW